MYGSSYGYKTGISNLMINHLKKKYDYLKKKKYFNNRSKILDIGSNDGTFLNFFENNLNRYGCDPTSTKFKKYYSPSILRIPKVFSNKIKLISNKKFKLVTSIAMFYDLNDPLQFCYDVEKILHRDGVFHIEIAYLPDINISIKY